MRRAQPWVHPISYRGQPIIVMRFWAEPTLIPTPDISARDISAHVQQLGLRPSDRYLTNVEASSRLIVVITHWGASINVDGIRVTHAADGAELIGWMPGAETTVVAVVSEEAPGDWSAFLREVLGQRRGFAARIRVRDYRPETEDPGSTRYRILSGDPGSITTLPSSGLTFLLDSNVLVDMERAAAGRTNPVSDAYKETQSLVLHLRPHDVVSGWAITELCGLRAGGFDVERSHRLSASLNAWFDIPLDEVLNASAVTARYESEAVAIRKKPSPVLEGAARFFNSVNYVSLLKVAELWLLSQQTPGFRARERVDSFRAYFDYVTADIDVMSAYPMQVAVDLFLGTPQNSQHARKLLKFGKDVIRNIWGAAWDLTQINALDMTDTRLISLENDDRQVALVTADRGMISLREHTLVLAPSDIPYYLVGGESSADRRLEPFRDEIQQLLDQTLNRSARLLALRPGEVTFSMDHIFREISRLEQRVVTLRKIDPGSQQPASKQTQGRPDPSDDPGEAHGGGAPVSSKRTLARVWRETAARLKQR